MHSASELAYRRSRTFRARRRRIWWERAYPTILCALAVVVALALLHNMGVD